MDNLSLKNEAAELLKKIELDSLLSTYPEWFIGGSYFYDLMVWRDLDIYILDAIHHLPGCFRVAYELTARLDAYKARFTNNVGNEPDGFYWGIKLGDERKGAWKLDVWFLNARSYDRHQNYALTMRERLTDRTRESILTIKGAYWQRREYRDTITSDLIYRAVIDHGVQTIGDFEQFLLK